MKLWEKFSEDELRDIILNSKTYREALQKIGYSGSSAQNRYIKEIANKYNISLSHFSTGGAIDIVGQTFGYLTVIKKVPSKNKGVARFLCKCECGNLKEVDGIHLRKRLTQSCGCLNIKRTIEANKEQKLIDMIGKRFGKLVVLKRVENIKQQPAYICKCDCGNITAPIKGANLRKGVTKSCGCLRSQGELKITQLLLENQILFKKEVTFLDCVSDKGGLLRFDFGIYTENGLSHLIEFNGRQHYEETNYFKGNLEQRQRNDNIKQQYCKEKKIPLIIIPYTQLNTLTIKDLLLEDLKT